MDSRLPFEQIGEFRLEFIIQDSPYTMAVRGYQTALKRPVFLKILKPHIKEHHSWIKRFSREARVSARLKHPNIVDVYTIGEFENYTYMAMEFIQGMSLKEMLEKEQFLESHIAIEIARQVLLALRLANENRIIHRDIKPGNILLDLHGQAKVTDFGLAFVGEEPGMTQQDAILGTPAYMSPEQVTDGEISSASDFFSLGATLYEMLSGVRAFSGQSYSACLHKILNEIPQSLQNLKPSLSEQLNRLVFQLIEKDPGNRPALASEIIRQLKDLPEYVSPTESGDQIVSIVKKYVAPGGQSVYETSTESAPDGSAAKASAKPSAKSKGNRTVLIGSAAIFGLILIAVLFNLSSIFRDGPEVGPNSNQFGNISLPGRSAIDSSGDTSTDTVGIKNEQQFAFNTEEQKKNKTAEPESPSETDEPTGNINSREKKDSTLPENSPEDKNVTDRQLPDKSEDLTQINLSLYPWAEIRLDGAVVDSMAREKKIPVDAGQHRLVLSHPEFPPKIFDFFMDDGETRNFNYSFLSDAGFLLVEVRPWAEVYVDGKYIDSTPLDRLIVLPAGEHLLELKHPDFSTYREILELGSGDTLRIQKSFLQ